MTLLQGIKKGQAVLRMTSIIQYPGDIDQALVTSGCCGTSHADTFETNRVQPIAMLYLEFAKRRIRLQSKAVRKVP